MASKLDGLHPKLVEKLQRLIAAMTALGYPMQIVQGLRTAEYQQGLYAQGRTKPGKIVTNCDGIKLKSNHQAASDGFGHAADLAFVDDPRTPANETWNEELWQRVGPAYGACAKAVGLVWGGDWKSIVDRPHVELPKEL